MKDKILFIGSSGYLGEHLIETLVSNFTIDEFKGRVENIHDFEKYTHNNYDYIFHFGSTNDDSIPSKVNKIEQGTRNCIAFANQQKAKMIYASTKGILSEHKNSYEQVKKNSTVEVRHSCNSYVCLLIPRVYSRDRKHGLIQAIKDNKPLDGKQVIYIKIKDFVWQTLEAMKQHNICFNYSGLNMKSTLDIKNWILK